MIKKITLLASLLVLTASAANVTETLSGIADSYTIIYYYNNSITSGTKWLYWDNTVPGGIGNNLLALNERDGYWIYVNATTATLNVTGTVPSSTDIPLTDGWNMVGYPSTSTNVNVTTAFSEIDGEYTILFLYNNSITSGTKWKYWDNTVPGGLGNTLVNLAPGYGLWIYVNATATTLTI